MLITALFTCLFDEVDIRHLARHQYDPARSPAADIETCTLKRGSDSPLRSLILIGDKIALDRVCWWKSSSYAAACVVFVQVHVVRLLR